MFFLRKRFSFHAGFNARPGLRILHSAFCVAIGLLLAAGPADAQVRVNVTQPSYTVNEELSLRAAIDGNPTQEAVDLYFALFVPGIDLLLFMGPDMVFTPSPVPALSGWNPFAVPEFPLVNYGFTGFEPEGDYFWAAAMFLAGRPLTAENLIGAVTTVPFHFGAPSILSWFPQQGEVLQTVEPDLSILFKKPVDRSSTVQHMEIKVESLLSGKTAEVKWIDGQRWLYLFDPEVGTLMQRVSETDYISPLWTEGDKRLTLHVSSYTIFGSTYSLHYGGSYRLTFNMLEGALFADGSSIEPGVIGPIDFSVARP